MFGIKLAPQSNSSVLVFLGVWGATPNLEEWMGAE
jgi:hypothetical protein